MPCARGEANDAGELCPYRTHEPESMEAWQAWDLALRCGGQLRSMKMAVIGIDFNTYIKMAEAMGYSCHAAAELAPACEVGIVEAMNKKIESAMKDH